MVENAEDGTEETMSGLKSQEPKSYLGPDVADITSRYAPQLQPLSSRRALHP